MSRSLKKGPWIDPRLLEKMGKVKKGDRVIIKTWSRDCSIAPEMVGFTFGVHNGKEHIAVFIAEDMVGHKLGEFAPSTIFKRHGGKMQRDLELKVEGAEAAKTEAVAKPVATKPVK